MKKSRFFKKYLKICFLFFWVFYIPLDNTASSYNSKTIQNIKLKESGLYNSNIYTNKENYSLFENVISTFNYTSPLIGDDYFRSGTGVELSPIFWVCSSCWVSPELVRCCSL